ncbi:hypothetical protein, partial [Pseudomonas viridiflava]|uniref:hypothetical protein n=1 Tax=Pseudomonas viridiflava TaxID=33069 RepID=UPI00197F8E9C
MIMLWYVHAANDSVAEQPAAGDATTHFYRLMIAINGQGPGTAGLRNVIGCAASRLMLGRFVVHT